MEESVFRTETSSNPTRPRHSSLHLVRGPRTRTGRSVKLTNRGTRAYTRGSEARVEIAAEIVRVFSVRHERTFARACARLRGAFDDFVPMLPYANSND